MRLRSAFTTLDRYLLHQVGGTFVSVFAIVISLMMFEHLPRLFEVVRLSGRKSYIVMQSLLALLPEYGGIGLLFGLYLAIALTVRRLSLRNELDIIQASGISTHRWLRFPVLLTLLVAGLLLWNQGWLMPLGEQRLNALSEQMREGQFGFDLEPGKFTDLGHGVTVKFEGIDGKSSQLREVFFQTPDTTFTANRGTLAFDFRNDILVDLEQGRMFNAGNGQSLSFSHFHFDSGDRESRYESALDAAKRRKATPLPALLASSDAADRAVAWSRLLWPAFAMAIPSLATVLGKPARRSSGSLGLMVGLILLVLFARSTGFVAAQVTTSPIMVALGVGAAWLAAIGFTLWGERRLGAGYVDDWMTKGSGRLKMTRQFGRRARGQAASTSR
jgi:lipopolysaccharide export LptBFGC system permease protein LptF